LSTGEAETHRPQTAEKTDLLGVLSVLGVLLRPIAGGWF
jgi:hypothetical protein